MVIAKDSSIQTLIKGPRPIRTTIGLRGSANSTLMTEAGVGALMPWADALYIHTYSAENNQGDGIGLWRMGDDLIPELLVEDKGVHTGRIIFSGNLYMGMQQISPAGVLTPITGIPSDQRIAAFSRYPSGTTTLMALTMAGRLYSINTTTLVATLVADLSDSTHLNVTGFKHFKAMTTADAANRLFVTANNNAPNGRFARVTTGGATGTLDTDNHSWVEVASSHFGNQHVFAIGHDYKSVTFWVSSGLDPALAPRRFRIPFPHRQQTWFFQQEWMRIRAVETERYIMDAHGGFFELQAFLTNNDDFATGFPIVEPICRHARTIPDYTVFNGALVLGGNNISPQGTNFPDSGQSAGGLLFTTIDDLWSWGKPGGIGHWYRNQAVTSGTISDPMLAKYDTVNIHLSNNGASTMTVDVLVYAGSSTAYTERTVTVGAGSYVHVSMDRGLGADWIAIRPNADSTDFTAWLTAS